MTNIGALISPPVEIYIGSAVQETSDNGYLFPPNCGLLSVRGNHPIDEYPAPICVPDVCTALLCGACSQEMLSII